MDISSIGSQGSALSGMDEMRQALFDKDDTDCSGFLEADELLVMAANSGQSVESILSDADVDGDGVLSQDEMSEMKPPPPPPKQGNGRLGGKADDDSLATLLEALENYSTESDNEEVADILEQFVESMSSGYGSNTTAGLFVNVAG